MNTLLSLLDENKALNQLMNGEGDIITSYIQDEVLLVAAAFKKKRQTMFIVKSNLYEARAFYENLKQYVPKDCAYFPFDEATRMEIMAESPEMLAERLNAYELLLKNKPCVVVTHTHGILRYLPTCDIYKQSRIHLSIGQVYDMKTFQKDLYRLGYTYIQSVDQPFYFSHRGGIIDVYSINYDHPLRIEFFDDEIDSIRFFDEKTQRTIETIEEAVVIPATELLYYDEEVPKCIEAIDEVYGEALTHLAVDQQADLEHIYSVDMERLERHEISGLMYKYYHYFSHDCSLLDYAPEALVVLASESGIHENEKLIFTELDSYQREMYEEGRMIYGLKQFQTVAEVLKKRSSCVRFENFQTHTKQVVFNTRSIDPIYKGTEEEIIKTLLQIQRHSTVIVALEEMKMIQKFSDLLTTYGLTFKSFGSPLEKTIYLYHGAFPIGIELGDEAVVILTSKELFGYTVQKKPGFVKYKNAQVLKNFEDLQEGDYIVHDTHGIGQYLGIKTLEVQGVHKDYLYIAYRGNDVLYLPVEQFKMIRKYQSREGKVPKINKLGSNEWTKTKQKIKAKTDKLAMDLQVLYAKRMAAQGFAFGQDDELQMQFEEAFGYELTPDQEAATLEIKHDMEQARPMDRLLCGDVGFGKTEVALRAAFKAVTNHKQVAYLCPTTILSSQHYRTMKERFKDFPVEIEMLNRYVSTKNAKEILSRLKEGKIDILVGTHRILSKDVVFNDIGLLIIDEEQRFGVRHKEKIKEMKESIDVLTLTATPIPRTLQLSLMGIRGLSTINTPPRDRMPVQTFVVEKSMAMIKQVIERELARDGQVFYLYNRTEDIELVAHKIEQLIPLAKVGVGHGKMDKTHLENVMNAFIQKEFNVLICTTIIETGIDIPNANTILVEDADHFGLSQLYQIRGRVGRSYRHAYAYLMHRTSKQLTPEATKRLKAIKEFTQLGSGYKIAMRDLNIRGAGDILGGEQAGFIDTVGFDTFMRILQESLAEQRGEQIEEEESVEISPVAVDGYIPEDYVNSDLEKLRLYQQLQNANTLATLDETKKELIDLYGRLPREVETLVNKREFDILVSDPAIDTVVSGKEHLEITYTSTASKRVDGEALMMYATQISKTIRISFLGGKITVKFNKVGSFLDHVNLFLRGQARFLRDDS